MRGVGGVGLVLVGVGACEVGDADKSSARLDAVDTRLDTIDARLRELDARVGRLEAAAPAGTGAAPTVDGRVAGLELRVAGLEGRAPEGGAAAGVVVRADGRVVPKPTAESSRACAYNVAAGIATAERAYEASFDTFSDDLATIGYTIDGTAGCDLLVGGRIQVMPREFVVTVVVKEGVAKGTAFEVRNTSQVTQLPRVLDAAEIRATLSGKGGFGW